MLQLTRGLKSGTFCKTGEKIFRAAVVHLFTCIQTLVILQAEIFQVSQQLFFFLQCFFHLGATKLLQFKVIHRTAHRPTLHCVLQPTASRPWEKLQGCSSVVEQEHRQTLIGTPYFSSYLSFFFHPPSLRKKKKITLGIQLSLRIGKLTLVSLTKGCAKQK